MTTQSKKKSWWILIALLVIAVGFMYINFEHLMRSPFEQGITFDEPDYAAMNKDGYKAVIDSFGTKVTIISPEDESIAIAGYSALSSVTPKAASYLSLDDKNVYILDKILNKDGTSSDGERILKYDFEGKFKDTVYTSKEDESLDENLRVVSIASNEGKVYAVGYYEEDDSSIVVADVTDGTIKVVHSFSCKDGIAYEYTYQADKDITTIVTYEGSIYSYFGENEPVEYIPDGQIDKVLYLDNGDVALFDINKDTIAICDELGGEEKAVIKTDAESFDACKNTLIYADPNAYSVSTYDVDTDTEKVLLSVPYTNSIKAMGYITWLMTLIGAFALIGLIVHFVILAIRKHKENEEEKTDNKKLLTTGKLYGNVFLIMIFVFAITAFIMGRYYYKNTAQRARTNVIETAYRITKTSPETFGDDVKAITSPKMYDSINYQRICSHIDYMCLGSLSIDNKNAMTCNVYRYVDGSDKVIIVKDSSDYNRIGTTLDTIDQERRQIKESLYGVREGYSEEAMVSYDNGIKLYQIYSPIYDSEENIVGATAVMINETGFVETIIEDLLAKLLEIFTLLAGFCILFAEIKYGLMVSKIKKALLRNGIKNTTVVEGDRTIGILLIIPGTIYILFYTLIVHKILLANGQAGNAFLLALPITIEGIIFAFVRTIGASITKHNPKKFMYFSVTVAIIAVLICIAATILNSYALIIISGIVMPISTGLSMVTTKTTKLSRKKPNDEYKLMVFCNVEKSIASAIGAALGAVVRGIYGDIGLMVLIIVLCLVTYPVIRSFVGDDIAVPKGEYAIDEKKKASIFTIISSNAYILKKPRMISAILLSSFPLGFLIYLSTYVLPLLNEYEGLPDVAIGTLTLLIQLLVLFVIPPIIKWLDSLKLSNELILVLAMGLMAIFLFIFGADGTMKTFVVAVFVVTLMKVHVPNVCDDIFIEEAGKEGVHANDLLMVWELFYGVGNYLAPMVFSFMFLSGPETIGYSWGIICSICVVLILLLSGFRLGKSTKKQEKA